MKGLVMRSQSLGIRTLLVAGVTAAVLTLSGSAQAATIRWVGGATNSWSTAANWSPPQVPGAGDYVVFNRDATSFTVNLGGGATVSAVEIENNAIGSYTFNQGMLTLTTGQFKVGGGQTHTVNCDVRIQGPGYILVGGGGTLILNNPIRESAGAFGLLKGWSGNLILNAVNLLSGDISIQSGTLTLGTDEGLRPNTIQLSANGTLSVDGLDPILGALGGSGDIAMGSATRLRFGENGATTTFSGSIVGSGQLVKQGEGGFTIDSDLTEFSGTIKHDAGTLTINGSLDEYVDFTSWDGVLTGNGRMGNFNQQAWWTGDFLGPIYPGGDGIGTLTADGWAYLGRLTVFDIGGLTPGVEHDQIVVNGYADTINWVDINLVNGFTPSAGDEFVLLQAESLDFIDKWHIRNAPAGFAWYLAHDRATGTVTLKVCPPDGNDCNNNGVNDDCEPDRDGDGIIDDCDICDNGPNDQDADNDGVPDACDVCPGVDDNGPDADLDGYPDACDPCYGNQLTGDDDADGICNHWDRCPGFDDNIDADGDSVPDGCDICPGYDDYGPDADNDSIPDVCDTCYGDNATGDDDNDGVCDDLDACPGSDDAVDADNDGVPDGCDLCQGDNATGDSDGDGKCDDLDICPDEDDYGPDADGDGLPDACDFCNVSNTGDLDSDGDLDAQDFDGFDICLTGPALDAGLICDCYDMDPDGEITIRDFGMFQRAFTGPKFIEEAQGEINIQNIANGLSDKGRAFFGGNATDFAGYAVALIGDINGDGYGEMLVGAPSYGEADQEHAGRVYLVYGGLSDRNLLLENIAGENAGLMIDGVGGFNHPYLTREIGESTAYPGNYEPFQEGGPQGEGAGYEVASAGDVNGDGIDDFIIAAPYGVANGAIWGGRVYVVFGNASFDGSTPVNLSALTAAGSTSGFRIEGERGACPSCPGSYVGYRDGDLFGWAADGARDVNGDGLADILVSAKNNGDDDQGRAYAIFGKADDAPISVASIGGESGPGILFDMGDVTSTMSMGHRLQSVADYNGDGLTDYIVAPEQWGITAYVAQGLTKPGVITLINSNNIENVVGIQGDGYECQWGEDPDTGEEVDYCIGRYSASLPVGGGGDFNGDGRPDVVRVDVNFTTGELEVLVFFNDDSNYLRTVTTFGAADSLLDPPAGGVRIFSDSIGGSSWKNGVTLNSDVNGDGYDDVVLGVGAGKRTTYVIFGGPASRSIDLDTLLEDGNGVRIGGGFSGSKPGYAIDTSGDVNGDGLNDIFIGDPGDDHRGNDAGAAYLVYGGDFSGSITHMGDDAANSLTGTSDADNMVAGRGNDTINGAGGADTIYAGAGDDIVIVSDAGFHRVRGGAGFDTLATSGGVTLDLEVLRGRIDEIEQINLGAPGADTLNVSRIDALNLSPTSNQLFIRGAAEDLVTSHADNWINEGLFDVDGVQFEKFVSGRAEVFIQDGVSLRFAPVILTESISMDENTPADASIGFVEATDPDGGRIDEYAIVGGAAQALFTIDADTGELFVSESMDFETLLQTSFTLDIRVTDDQAETDEATITINVQDVNEAPVWTFQDQRFTTLAEHAQSGLVVGQFTAVDADAGDQVSYALDLDDPSLTSPAPSGAFAIDAATGELIVANGAALDREMQEVHEMLVYAEDTSGLRSTSIKVTLTLTDVQAWVERFSGVFETTNASMWSADGGVGLSEIQFEKDVDFDGSSSQSVSLLGVDLTGQVSGQIHFESAITTDSGAVNATIPFAAEVSIPDEVQLGQPFTLGFYQLDPLDSPTMTGMTPAADIDMLLEFHDLAISTTPHDFGPFNGSNSADEYLTSSVGRAWSAGVQPDGSLATNSTVSTTLLQMGAIDWDSYLENFLSLASLPANEGSFDGIEYGTVRMNMSYVLWAMNMNGAVSVEQDFALDVDGYTAEIVFENGVRQTIAVDGDTQVTLPAGADANGDGFADYDIHVDIETTFTNNSDFYGTISQNLQLGYFYFQAFYPTCPSCGVNTAELGPLGDRTINVDVFRSDALGPFPTPWPENEPGQFPLGGFNTVILRGSIDLNS